MAGILGEKKAKALDTTRNGTQRETRQTKTCSAARELENRPLGSTAILEGNGPPDETRGKTDPRGSMPTHLDHCNLTGKMHIGKIKKGAAGKKISISTHYLQVFPPDIRYRSQERKRGRLYLEPKMVF